MNKHKHQFNWTDGVLIGIAIATAVFLHRVFEVMIITQVEPSATVTGFFGFVTAECAILWRLHESSKKRKTRREEREEKDTFADNFTDADDINNGDGEG